jgi:uncharacterized glyoxalase superfamily protein PhnB
MSKVEPVPEGVHTVVPRLVFTRGEGTKAMQLYVDAFGAQVVEEPHLMPDGQLIHAHIRIGTRRSSSPMKRRGRAPVTRRTVSAVMAVHIPNVDGSGSARHAGCGDLSAADQFCGDRGGRLRDPFDIRMLKTAIEDVSPKR